MVQVSDLFSFDGLKTQLNSNVKLKRVILVMRPSFFRQLSKYMTSTRCSELLGYMRLLYEDIT